MLTEMRNRSEVEPTPARLTNPFYFYVRVFLYLTAAFVVLPWGLFALNQEAGLVGVLTGFALSLSMLLSALITALGAWSVSRRLKRFQAGEFLAHWTYTREEWLAFAESEWEHRCREVRQYPRLGLIIGGLTGLILGGEAGYVLVTGVLATVLGALAGLVVVGLLSALVGWLGGRAVRYAGWCTYKRMQDRIGETYIGMEAAYCGECYWSWTAMNFRLMGMELTPGRPAVLVFKLRVYMGRSGYALYNYRTPVPQGREEEARQVLHYLCSAW
jgi:hypothetical protein